MQKPIEFYKAEKAKFELEFKKLKKKLATLSALRLLVFLIIIAEIYFFYSNIKYLSVFLIITISIFIYLLIKYSDYQNKRNLVQKLVEINNIEILVLQGDYFSLDQGTEFINPNHFYSYDIDLFGRGSFFQYCNRTGTADGKKKLATYLTNNNIDKIREKQEAIKELAKMPKWRQYFTAKANLIQVKQSGKQIINWIHHYESVFPDFISWLPLVFSSVSVLLFLLVSFSLANAQWLVIWFFVGMGVSGVFFKRINVLYSNSSKAKDTFKQYHQLLNEIENCNFSSKLLLQKQKSIQNESEKASTIFAKFSKLLDAFDQRHNHLVGILGNAFLLRDLNLAIKVEKWISQYHQKVEIWFEVIAFFDAQNSLANYAFNHPEYYFPDIKENQNVIKSINLGHPLLKVTRRIDNNFTINNQQFYIITGANMAGKSTFLRTISLSIIMANAGLPVCAQSFAYSPIKLITSMRTSDSLTDDESYFFSELKRLKFIVDSIQEDRYFIVLDEILKGTNSEDKAIGSKKFVKKLVNSGSTGIIATHDLSLCEIEKEFKQINNMYFDAEIVNDELFFDYKLKKGICKNMNASFLLKKMGIV